MTLLGALGMQELFLLFVILIVPLIALIEIIRSDFKQPVNKVVWILVVILLPLVGSILFWILGRSQKQAQ